MCSQLCYTSSPRRRGIVRRIDYGSYRCIGTEGRDVFFHMECVYGTTTLNVGDAVLFSSYEGGGAPRALPVVKLNTDQD